MIYTKDKIKYLGVRLPIELYAKVEKAAKKSGSKMSAIIRDCLESGLPESEERNVTA